jgi:hypothetical protein
MWFTKDYLGEVGEADGTDEDPDQEDGS